MHETGLILSTFSFSRFAFRPRLPPSTVRRSLDLLCIVDRPIEHFASMGGPWVVQEKTPPCCPGSGVQKVCMILFLPLSCPWSSCRPGPALLLISNRFSSAVTLLLSSFLRPSVVNSPLGHCSLVDVVFWVFDSRTAARFTSSCISDRMAHTSDLHAMSSSSLSFPFLPFLPPPSPRATPRHTFPTGGSLHA